VFSAGSGQRRRLLAGPARLGASALGLEAGEAPGDEFAARHGLYWLCANLAERTPLLIAVDDLQWVDGPSLAWLLYLGRRTPDLPVLVVTGVREGDPRAAQPDLAALVTDPVVEHLRPAPLAAGSVATVIGAELGHPASPDFSLACWELTGGNPLYVRLLAAAARGEGLTGDGAEVAALRSLAAAAVGASVLPRLEKLGPGMIALARALAVAGAGTEVAVAAELAGLPVAAAELMADTLAAAQILAPAREIAQALFITTKTAAVHLTHVYRKLGISRRAQLPGALASSIPGPGDAAPDQAGTIS
jgi:hypothetical protein